MRGIPNSFFKPLLSTWISVPFANLTLHRHSSGLATTLLIISPRWWPRTLYWWRLRRSVINAALLYTYCTTLKSPTATVNWLAIVSFAHALLSLADTTYFILWWLVIAVWQNLQHLKHSYHQDQPFKFFKFATNVKDKYAISHPWSSLRSIGR